MSAPVPSVPLTYPSPPPPATQPLPAALARRHLLAGRGRVHVLRGYLAGVFLLLLLVLAVTPPAPQAEQPGRAPAHRLEPVQVRGGGLNNFTRWAIQGAAWSTAQAVDRQGDLLAPSPLVSRLLGPLTRRVGVWRDANRAFLLSIVLTAIVVLVLGGILTRPVQLRWLLVLGVVLVWSVTAAYPRAVLRAASLPGDAATRLVVAVAGPATPGGADPGAAQARLGEQYWTAFVTQPYSRVQTGTSVLAQAPPAQRASLLNTLARKVASIAGRVNGDHALERAVTGVLALASAVVFALAVTACSALGWLAQSLLFLLCLAAVVGFPVLVGDARARRLLPRWWLLPLLGALGLTVAGTLGSILAAKAAVALAGTGEAVGRLCTGSIVALLLVLLAVRWWRRLARRLAPTTTTTTTATAPAATPTTTNPAAEGGHAA
jgi:hypothetical protein